MQRSWTFILTVFACLLVAATYGLFHDQITYSISEEYYTKFKFGQFGLEPTWFGGERATVAVVGVLATWWTGLFIGVGFGVTGLVVKEPDIRAKAIKRAILICICFSVAAGFFGYGYGRYMVNNMYVDWVLPEGVLDSGAFVTVSYIHNFSYLGGLLGLLAGVLYLFNVNWRRKRMRGIDSRRDNQTN